MRKRRTTRARWPPINNHPLLSPSDDAQDRAVKKIEAGHRPELLTLGEVAWRGERGAGWALGVSYNPLLKAAREPLKSASANAEPQR